MAENLLINGGAETDSTAGYSAASGATITRVTDEVYEGERAFRVETALQAQSGIQIFSNTSLEDAPGTHTYRSGAWVKGAGSLIYWLRVTYQSGEGQDNTDQTPVTLSDTWTHITPPNLITDPTKTIDRLWFQIRAAPTAEITFWVDSAYAYGIDSSAPRPSRVFVLGSPHNIGPLPVGKRR